MIPTVEQIVKDLQAGIITGAQALAWLKTHIEMAHEDGYQTRKDMEGD